MKTATNKGFNQMVLPEAGDMLTAEWYEKIASNTLYLNDEVDSLLNLKRLDIFTRDTLTLVNNTTAADYIVARSYFPDELFTLYFHAAVYRAAGAGSNPTVTIGVYINDTVMETLAQEVTSDTTATHFAIDFTVYQYIGTFREIKIKVHRNAGTNDAQVETSYAFIGR